MIGRNENCQMEDDKDFSKKKKVFLITTETSGDLLAGSLLRHLFKMQPGLDVRGVGGIQARLEGMNTLYSVEDFNVMGLFEVIGKLPKLRRQFDDLVTYCQSWEPDVVILVDAPDFNIRMAKVIKTFGFPIVYYVSPQVWAWRKSRATQIASLVDHMMVLFEFETDIYRKLGLKTSWVGHPLVEDLQDFVPAPEVLELVKKNPKAKTIVLAPGSRYSELSRHLQILKGVVDQAPGDIQFLLPLAPSLKNADLGNLSERNNLHILQGNMRSAMSLADAAVVASGTATLETALLGVPMVVGYRMSSLSYNLALRLVKVEHIALVNIVLGKRVVPELIQEDFCPESIWKILKTLLTSEHERQIMKCEFSKLGAILGGLGASERAAEVVGAYL